MKRNRSDTSRKAVIGSIAAIQVDRRDILKPNAVLGSAYKILELAAGGCLVATVHGTIVKKGNKSLYIPKS
jgi:hypothetical protein